MRAGRERWIVGQVVGRRATGRRYAMEVIFDKLALDLWAGEDLMIRRFAFTTNFHFGAVHELVTGRKTIRACDWSSTRTFRCMKMIRTNALRAIDLLALVGLTNINDDVGRERWLTYGGCHTRELGPMNAKII
jgi:hypothetical protein